jgi:RND family efflux transporter MFP subunit
VELKFQSAETIAAVYVKNGDRVQKGQKLGELDKFRLHRRTEAARDALSRARLELQDVLIGQGYALADSAKVPVATMQLARVKSGYDKARIDYDLTLFEEQHAVLTAPFDGIVANLFTRALNTASPQEAFCTVIDNQSLEADFTVLESELALIKLGDRVRVSPFSAPDAEVEGRISEINPLVNADGMVKVKAAVSGGGKLFEGMNVRVRIQRLLGKKLVVPKEAVVLRSGKQVVFTLEKGKAMWNYVTTGLENVDSYTVEDGLKEGDVVIVSGNINLAHEAPVSVL